MRSPLHAARVSRWLAAVPAAAVGFAACGEEAMAPDLTRPPPVAPIVFRNVNVLPMSDDRVLPNHAVVAEDGRITWMGPDGDAPVPDGAIVVDGGDRYLLPGLSDMHVHTSRDEEFMLYVANGVTTVRGMAGAPERLAFRARIEQGEMIGPRYLLASPKIDGPNPGGFQGQVAVSSVEEAAGIVRQQVTAGYDFLKVYSNLSLEVYKDLIRQADAVGMEVVGHVPTAIPLDTALAYHHRSHEHLFGYVDAIEASDSPVLGEWTWRRIYGGIDIDEDRLPALAAKVGAAQVWNSPTLLNHDKWVPADLSAELLRRDVMKYVHPSRRNSWDPANSPIQNLPEVLFDWTPERFEQGRTNLGRIVKALHDAGAGLILGTDAGSTHLVHGFAVHDELERMVEAGLSNYEALRTATSAVGEYLGEAGIGVVTVGAEPDLVLVGENPLESLGALRQPAGVLVRGRWFDRARLDDLLALVEVAFQ